MWSLDSDEVKLVAIAVHEIKQRYTNNGKGLVCNDCAEFVNESSQSIDPMVLISTSAAVRQMLKRVTVNTPE